MSESTAPNLAAPESPKSRVGKLMRWAARITSVPIFGLVLTSLVPAALSFSISARDDRIIAIGLGVTCLGLVLGWRWAGIGGAVLLSGVVTMLTQSDDWLYPDPFSIAFGLQGALFLISSVVNASRDSTSTPAFGWVRKAAVALLVITALVGVAAIVRGPGPVPVPRDKEPFVGVWKSPTGFDLEIKSDGHAAVTWEKDTKADLTNNPVDPGTSANFFAYFHGDEELELSTGPLRHAKVYRIDRPPRREGKQTRMVLNGSEPYKRGTGVSLVKQVSQ